MLLLLTMLETEEEKELFQAVYTKYRYFMWYLANNVLQDSYLAEDAVQEALLALTKHMDKLDSANSSRTKNFLATIVRHKAVDILRKRKHSEVSIEDEDMETVSSNEQDLLDQYITKDSYSRLLKCIAMLDIKYRTVFEYKYLHQLTDQEIAQLLGVSMKLVNVRFFRARRKLQEMLQKEVRDIV